MSSTIVATMMVLGRAEFVTGLLSSSPLVYSVVQRSSRRHVKNEFGLTRRWMSTSDVEKASKSTSFHGASLSPEEVKAAREAKK
jgi:hypothetical protein